VGALTPGSAFTPAPPQETFPGAANTFDPGRTPKRGSWLVALAVLGALGLAVGGWMLTAPHGGSTSNGGTSEGGAASAVPPDPPDSDGAHEGATPSVELVPPATDSAATDSAAKDLATSAPAPSGARSGRVAPPPPSAPTSPPKSTPKPPPPITTPPPSAPNCEGANALVLQDGKYKVRPECR
jgi:hypothetical protein